MPSCANFCILLFLVSAPQTRGFPEKGANISAISPDGNRGKLCVSGVNENECPSDPCQSTPGAAGGLPGPVPVVYPKACCVDFKCCCCCEPGDCAPDGPCSS